MDCKICQKCKQKKTVAEFHANKNKLDGLHIWCKICIRDYQIIYNEVNKDKHREYVKERRLLYKELDSQYDYKSKLMTQYGLTIEEFNDILKEQDGVCAICGTDDWGGRGGNTPHIDHCHDSNIIRGLLCFNCNTMLGLVRDSIEILRKAADYLENVTDIRSITIEQRKIIHRVNGTSAIAPKILNSNKKNAKISSRRRKPPVESFEL